AAGAVKTLRARAFGGEGTGQSAGGAIGLVARQLAKNLTNKINGWNADDAEGDEGTNRTTGGEKKEAPVVDPIAAAAAVRAAERAAVRQGAAARAKSAGGGGRRKKVAVERPNP
ncbi:unnamed protein product, partial [Ectocarpus sp. 8 AP-2014]